MKKLCLLLVSLLLAGVLGLRVYAAVRLGEDLAGPAPEAGTVSPPPAAAPDAASPAAAAPSAGTEPETAAPGPAGTPEASAAPAESVSAPPAPRERSGGKRYTEETYQLVTDLVYLRRHWDEDGPARTAATLERLKAADPALGEAWEGIMACWDRVSGDLTLNPGALPEGLPQDNSLCLVVLGFQLLYDGDMAPELTGRCETALRCAQQYPEALIAVTGGGTALGDREATEAGVMAAWFRAQGIPAERLLIEDASLTTADNAVLTAALLREKAPQVRELLLVSSDYHLPLGCLLFEEKALLSAYGEGTKPFTVAGTAAWDSRGRFLPDTPQQQKMYLWSVADPKY